MKNEISYGYLQTFLFPAVTFPAVTFPAVTDRLFHRVPF